MLLTLQRPRFTIKDKTGPGFWAHGLNKKVEASEDSKSLPTERCGQEDTSLSQKGQVQQHSTPRAQDGKALDVPPLLSFPFQKICGGEWGCKRGSRHACEESATYLEILVEGNSLEEKLCQLLLQVGEESH